MLNNPTVFEKGCNKIHIFFYSFAFYSEHFFKTKMKHGNLEQLRPLYDIQKVTETQWSGNLTYEHFDDVLSEITQLRFGEVWPPLLS